GSRKELEASADGVSRTDLLDQAFYPLTLPLATGPGTIAVVISLGLSRASYTSSTDEIVFVLASLAAAVAIASYHFLVFCLRGSGSGCSAAVPTSPCGFLHSFCSPLVSRFSGQAGASY